MEWPYLMVQWFRQVDFFGALNTQFVSSLLAALAGAYAGAYGAWKFAEHRERKAKLFSELQTINKSISLATGVCNDAIGLKRQHVRKLAEDFEAQRTAAMKVISGASTSSPVVIELVAVMRHLPAPTYPLDSLSRLVLEVPAVAPRITSGLAQILGAMENLKFFIQKRSNLIEDRKKIGFKSDRELAEFYLGVPDSKGNSDTTYGDVLMAIKMHTDDVIFFSHLLVNDLIKKGEVTANKLKKFKGVVERPVFKVDWSKAIAEKLIPSEDQYKDWLQGFRDEDI